MHQYNFKVFDIFNGFYNSLNPVSVHDGVGVEIEVEGRNLVHETLLSYWDYHVDNSLKGEENAEYTLKFPVEPSKLYKALNYLEKKLTNNKYKAFPSHRASVHVHLNAQQLSLVQVYNIVTVYTILEEVLLDYCGADRKGNLFCLSAEDADYLLSILKQCARSGTVHPLANEDLRYAGLNLNSLLKFGSLEFRTMRCPVDKSKLDFDTIKEWVDILVAIKNYAVQFRDPSAIIGRFSVTSPVWFLSDIFPTKLRAKLIDQVGSTERTSFYLVKGMRLVQDFAYCTPWQVEEAKPGTKMPKQKKSWTSAAPSLAISDEVLNTQTFFYTDSTS